MKFTLDQVLVLLEAKVVLKTEQDILQYLYDCYEVTDEQFSKLMSYPSEENNSEDNFKI